MRTGMRVYDTFFSKVHSHVVINIPHLLPIQYLRHQKIQTQEEIKSSCRQTREESENRSQLDIATIRRSCPAGESKQRGIRLGLAKLNLWLIRAPENLTIKNPENIIIEITKGSLSTNVGKTSRKPHSYDICCPTFRALVTAAATTTTGLVAETNLVVWDVFFSEKQKG